MCGALEVPSWLISIGFRRRAPTFPRWWMVPVKIFQIPNIYSQITFINFLFFFQNLLGGSLVLLSEVRVWQNNSRKYFFALSLCFFQLLFVVLRPVWALDHMWKILRILSFLPKSYSGSFQTAESLDRSQSYSFQARPPKLRRRYFRPPIYPPTKFDRERTTFCLKILFSS